MKFRNVCFTINNYTPADISRVKWMYSNGDASYIVYGHEVGESGTPHLQGYMELSKEIAQNKLKQLLPKAHLEVRKSTAVDASDYCKKGVQSHEEWKQLKTEGPNYGKDAEVYEVGAISQQGKRTDIDEVCEYIQAGATIRNVAHKYPAQYVKYHRGFEKLRQFYIEEREEPPEVYVLWGSTGTGKSKMARELLGPRPYVWNPQQGHWFDGYDGHEDVIIEEFRGQFPFGMLLSLLDRYTSTVQVKGGVNQFVAKKIVITSPVSPIQWYTSLSEVEGRIDQLMRRITEVRHLS